MEDILINVTLRSNPAHNDKTNPTATKWFVEGSIEGKIALGSDMNKEGKDQKQDTAGMGAFVFDTSAGPGSLVS
jgi:hypothetical protein